MVVAVEVAAPCVIGGASTTAFGVTLSGGTLAGNFAVGSGITGVTSIAGNLIAGRDPFSNAPINMIVGGLTNMLGGSTRGWGSLAGNGLGGALEGGLNSWLDGGTGEEIARDAAIGASLNIGFSALLNRIFCFAKDTPVWTSEGPRPIGEIKPGEKVRAFHFEQGEWVHATVTDRSDNVYQGPVVTVEVGGSKIETTVYHPFWVVEGQNLDERAVPKELLPEEDEGKSLKGRWVNSHDLRAGDKIYSLSGKLETIQAVSQRFEETFAVCNLTIDGLHNYAVGLCGVLVHNAAGCGVNLNSNSAIANFGIYKIFVNGSIYKVGKAHLDRITKATGLPTRLHQQIRKLEKVFGKKNVIPGAIDELGEVTTQLAKQLENKAILDEFISSGFIPLGNWKSFRRRSQTSNATRN